MKLFDFVDVKHLSTTDKGTTHEALSIPNDGLILGYRKKGSVNGSHWHNGDVPSKKPEHFFLLEGKMEVYGKHLSTGEELTRIIEAPQVVRIYPKVFHRFTALEDTRFMEFNSIAAHVADTHYPVKEKTL
jgi:dTDP-4-dehydrorhamnose 3,5-epimerase-like enzyme